MQGICRLSWGPLSRGGFWLPKLTWCCFRKNRPRIWLWRGDLSPLGTTSSFHRGDLSKGWWD